MTELDPFSGYASVDEYGVFADEDSASYSPLERLKMRIEDDNSYTRRWAAKEFPETMMCAESHEEFKEMLDFLNVIVRDPDSSVRIEITENIPQIADLCQLKNDEYLQTFIIPNTICLMMDANGQVRKSSHIALMSLINKNQINLEQIQNDVWPMLEEMGSTSNPDELRSESVNLVCKVASLLGQEMSMKLILPHFIEMCQDNVFNVRKACATNMGELSTILGIDATEKYLLTVFYALCEDNVWGVRKACAECTAEVSKFSTNESRCNNLTSAYYKLLTDQSRWVRVTAYQQLGFFIATFSNPELSGLSLDENGKICKLLTATNAPTEVSTNNTVKEKSEEVLGEEPPASLQSEASSIGGDDVFLSPSGRRSRTVSSSYDVSSDKTVRIHLDNTDDFGNIAYWNTPMPELDVELDIVDGKPKSIHVITRMSDSVRNRVYTSEIDFGIEDGVTTKKSETVLLDDAVGDLSLNQGKALRVHTSSVSSVETDSFGRNFSRTVSSGGDCSSPIDMNRKLNILPTPESLASKQRIIPDTLLVAFINMADSDKMQSVDSEIRKHCAFSLPAVAFTLGAMNWSCLRSLYAILAQDLQWKVRRTLAFSLHKLAQILGPEVIAADLMAVFHDFVRDVDEVKLGLVSNLSQLCHCLPQSLLGEVVEKLPELFALENDRNWRYRVEFALQLADLTDLLSQSDVQDHLIPFMWRLLMEKVAEVRRAAFGLVASVFKKTSNRSSLLDTIVTRLSESESWVNRQTFVQLYIYLVEEKVLDWETLSATLLPRYLELAKSDPVPNIRIVAIRGLVRVFTHIDYFSDASSPHHTPILETIEKLKLDKDKDVRYFVVESEESPQVNLDEISV